MENINANEVIEQPQEAVEPVVDEVSLPELMQTDTADVTKVESPVEADAPTQDNAGADILEQKPNTQKDIDAAIGKRLQKERDKYTNSVEYRLGKMFLEERMNQDNIDANEAFSRINSELNDRKAKEYARNPEQFYRDYLNGRTAPAEQGRESNSIENTASGLAEELREAQSNGAMPNSFTKGDITPEFVANMQKYGAEAALKIWEASHTSEAAAEVAAQKAAPQPMRVAGTSVSAPSVDFRTMSSDDFAKFEAKVKAANLAGKRVRF